MFTNYVAGFVFRKEGTEVALIKKNKPDWQRGKLNGVGGKVEPFDDSDHQAMAREFREETGVTTQAGQWSEIAELNCADATITFFVYRPGGDGMVLQNITDEAVDWYRVRDLPSSGTLPGWTRKA